MIGTPPVQRWTPPPGRDAMQSVVSFESPICYIGLQRIISMNSPKSATIAALAVCIAILVSCGKEAPQTNVIIIGVDTLRPDHLGCYGYGRATSPNIDKFAASGVLCENAISQSPWTLPSFATVFTSLYPTQHGAMVVKSRMRESFPTLATILRDAGYATGAIINAPALKPANGVDRGFDHYHMTPLDGRNADGTTRDALAWLDSVGDKPWFAFVHYFDPHLSYSPPAPYDKLYDPGYEGRIGDSFDLEGFSRVRDVMFEELKVLSAADWNHIVSLYDGEIAFTDKAIDDLLRGLEDRNLLTNTLVVFLSDHGEEFYEHGGFEHGHSHYNELIWVPLVFSLPGVLPEGARLVRQVRLLDVAPTVLDILGMDSPRHFEGASLKPLLDGTGMPPASEGCLLPHDIAYSEAIMHGPEIKSVSAYPMKLVHHMLSGKDMVFDLETDPEELRNLAGEEPDRSVELGETLFKTLFGLSGTWYMELVAGGTNHTFDLRIAAEKGLMIGRFSPYRLYASNGRLLDNQDVLSTERQGSILNADGFDLKGAVTLAFKVDLERIPVKFDFKIDGVRAGTRTYIGEAVTQPVEMPFTIKAGKGRAKAPGKPSGDLTPPYVLLWYEESPYRGDTAIKLDEETTKELRSLGYIQ
jgi:arylsulfatase A-like enzyme